MANVRMSQETKDKFDASFEAMKSENPQATQDMLVSAALDALAQADSEDVFDEFETVGMADVRHIMSDAYRSMERVLAHRYRTQVEFEAAFNKNIDELKELVARYEEQVDARDKQLDAQEAELKVLRTKAASVDALTAQIEAIRNEHGDREVAHLERLDKLTAMFEAEAKRHEEQERALREQVEQLQVQLTEREQSAK